MRHDDDEDSQTHDEGDGSHGDHEPFSLSRVIVVSSNSTVAIVTSRTVAAEAAAAAVRATVTSSIASPGDASVTKAAQGSLRVPSQRGGHTSKYGHTHHDDDDGHNLEDARRRRPLVEMLELIIRVVGVGWLGRGITDEKDRTGRKTIIHDSKPLISKDDLFAPIFPKPGVKIAYCNANVNST